jgi:hypothetical protein
MKFVSKTPCRSRSERCQGRGLPPLLTLHDLSVLSGTRVSCVVREATSSAENSHLSHRKPCASHVSIRTRKGSTSVGPTVFKVSRRRLRTECPEHEKGEDWLHKRGVDLPRTDVLNASRGHVRGASKKVSEHPPTDQRTHKTGCLAHKKEVKIFLLGVSKLPGVLCLLAST